MKTENRYPITKTVVFQLPHICLSFLWTHPICEEYTIYIQLIFLWWWYVFLHVIYSKSLQELIKIYIITIFSTTARFALANFKGNKPYNWTWNNNELAQFSFCDIFLLLSALSLQQIHCKQKVKGPYLYMQQHYCLLQFDKR